MKSRSLFERLGRSRQSGLLVSTLSGSTRVYPVGSLLAALMAMMGSDGTGICSVYARAGPVGQQQQQQQRLPAGHEQGILYQ